MVKAMEWRKYITPKKAMKLQPCREVLKVAVTTAEVDRMPMTSQGLNLPNRVRVRSMILPMMGSFRPSNTRAATIMTVTR